MAKQNNSSYGGVVAGDLSASGQSAPPFCPVPGAFNVTASGTWTGSWGLQRSFDGGDTWHAYTLLDQAFAPTGNVSTEFEQVESDTLWRINATVSSGTLNYRLSQ